MRVLYGLSLGIAEQHASKTSKNHAMHGITEQKDDDRPREFARRMINVLVMRQQNSVFC